MSVWKNEWLMLTYLREKIAFQNWYICYTFWWYEFVFTLFII